MNIQKKNVYTGHGRTLASGLLIQRSEFIHHHYLTSNHIGIKIYFTG